MVIHKHPNVSFHSEQGEGGLVVEVEQQLALGALYPVHRLDRVTSGLLLLARSSAAAAELSRLFAKRRVDKYYLALADRKPGKKQGLVIGDMVRSRRGGWKLSNNHSNPARTRFFSFGLGDGLRLFVLKPLTGKTHQLRVMMKSVGAPIIGDSRYYNGTSKWTVDRAYLHAYQLGFDYAGRSWRYQVEPQQGALFEDGRVRLKLMQLGDLAQLDWPED